MIYPILDLKNLPKCIQTEYFRILLLKAAKNGEHIYQNDRDRNFSSGRYRGCYHETREYTGGVKAA